MERKVQIIGEAARHVSRAFQDSHPEIPWNPIVVQRHRLVHEYGLIKDERIWQVATMHAAALVLLIRAVLPADPGSGESPG